MNKKELEAGQEPQEAGANQEPAERKTEFEKKVEAAGDDPALLKEVTTELLSALSMARKESAGHRTVNKTLKEKLEKFESDKTKEERSKMSELERLQAENADYQKILEQERAEKAQLKVQQHFSDANDPQDLVNRWEKLSDDEKAATTPQDWVESLKETASYLFKSTEPAPSVGPGPKNDNNAGNLPPTGTFNMYPQTQEESDALIEDYYKTFG